MSTSNEESKKKKKTRTRRHSARCPCNEHIRTQTQYFAPTVERLTKVDDEKKQRKLLRKCDPCFIRYIGRCADGILRTCVKLKQSDYDQLKPAKQLLLKLAHPYITLKKKRKLLRNQNGGAFPFLSVLGSLVTSIIGDLIVRR